jgi:hypothetical protein
VVSEVADHGHFGFIYLFLFFDETGVCTQGFMLAKQAFYHLSHTFSPF